VKTVFLHQPPDHASEIKKKKRNREKRIQLASLFLDGSFGKSKAVVAHVKFSVVWADEDVTEDPQRSHGLGDVQSHEARKANALTSLVDAKDVIGRLEGEGFATDDEIDVRHSGQAIAVDHVFSMGQGCRSDLGLQLGDFLERSGDEGSAGIGDGLASALAERRTADLHSVHFELPISAASHGHVGEVAVVARGVGSAEDDLTSFVRGRVAAEVKGEDGRRHQILSHHVVEDGRNAVDGDCIESHAKNAVEFSRDEGHARFVGSLGEGLTFDLERADGNDVGGEKAGETAGSVTNGELRAILDVGGRGSAVVFVVQKAGNVKQRTLLGGHPQVGRAGVKDDFEGLRWSSNGDGTKVLRIHVVGQWLGLWSVGRIFVGKHGVGFDDIFHVSVDPVHVLPH